MQDPLFPVNTLLFSLIRKTQISVMFLAKIAPYSIFLSNLFFFSIVDDIWVELLYLEDPSSMLY